MARYDVYRLRRGGYVVDCQADLLSALNTRFVVPLLPPSDAPKPMGRLNPSIEVAGVEYLMVTQYAAALPVVDLGEAVASVHDRDTDIGNALDMLLVGF